jgi:pimeloyl-ACP methyl ester carboxylesterase
VAGSTEQWIAVNRFDGTCTLYRFAWDSGRVAEAGRLPMTVTGGLWLEAGQRLALNLVSDTGRASVYVIDVVEETFNLLFEASPDSEDRIVLFDEASATAVFTTDAYGYAAVGVVRLRDPGRGVQFFPALDEGDEGGVPCAFATVGGRLQIVLRHEAGIWARLRLADPDTMTVSPPLPVPDGEVGVPVAFTGDRLRFPFSTPDQPWRAASLALDGTFSVDAPDEPYRPGRAQLFPGPAGPMPALVVEPDPKFDRGDLAVVALHGGPIARTGAEWQAEWQLFARLGLPVVALDYPGSTGWGQAYMRSLFGHAGEIDVAAVTSVVDALAASGRRVILYGESYGAFLALLAGAARPVAGIIALAPFAGFSSLRRSGSDEVRDVLELLDGGNSDETGRNAAEACRIIRSRVLIVHGTADRTIPVDESRALVAALRGRKGAGEDGVTFLELESQGHELSGRDALARTFLEMAGFVGGLQ